MLAPMTFIVTLVFILAVVVGLIVLIRAFAPGGSAHDKLCSDVGGPLGTQARCPYCGKVNPTHARFCGQCGKALS